MIFAKLLIYLEPINSWPSSSLENQNLQYETFLYGYWVIRLFIIDMASDTSPIYYYFLLNHFLRRWRMFSIFDGTVYIDFLRVKVKFREESERGHFSAFTGDEGENFLWWRRRIWWWNSINLSLGMCGGSSDVPRTVQGSVGAGQLQPSAEAGPTGWWAHPGAQTCIQRPAREGLSPLTQKLLGNVSLEKKALGSLVLTGFPQKPSKETKSCRMPRDRMSVDPHDEGGVNGWAGDWCCPRAMPESPCGGLLLFLSVALWEHRSGMENLPVSAVGQITAKGDRFQVPRNVRS